MTAFLFVSLAGWQIFAAIVVLFVVVPFIIGRVMASHNDIYRIDDR